MRGEGEEPATSVKGAQWPLNFRCRSGEGKKKKKIDPSSQYPMLIGYCKRRTLIVHPNAEDRLKKKKKGKKKTKRPHILAGREEKKAVRAPFCFSVHKHGGVGGGEKKGKDSTFSTWHTIKKKDCSLCLFRQAQSGVEERRRKEKRGGRWRAFCCICVEKGKK